MVKHGQNVRHNKSTQTVVFQDLIQSLERSCYSRLISVLFRRILLTPSHQAVPEASWVVAEEKIHEQLPFGVVIGGCWNWRYGVALASLHLAVWPQISYEDPFHL